MKATLTPALLASSLGLFLLSSPPVSGYEAEDGDIIFHRSQSAQSEAIAEATHSPFTHVGVIFIENGEAVVYEASGCVRSVPLAKFIACGENCHFVIKRLKDSEKLDAKALKREVKKMTGRCYDPYFDWSDSTIYCSELVWKAYQRGCGIELGDLRQMRDFDLDSPAVVKLLQCRYGKKAPLEMQVIAPSDIFGSSLLKTVAAEGGTRGLMSILGKLVGGG